MKKDYIIILILILIIIIYTNYLNRKVPIIHDVHIINLERSKDRWYDVQLELSKLHPLKVKRWPATDGKTLSKNDYISENIPKRIYGAEGFNNPLNERNKFGVIGCFLSHKKLLQYLQSLNVPKNHGHLILEDDIYIKSDTLTHWRKIYKNLNPNWDIVYFGIENNGKNYEKGPSIGGFEKVKNGSWGCYGYMVKHSTLPNILEKLKFMDDAIDAVYNKNLNTFNCYALSDIKITVTNVKSTIQV